MQTLTHASPESLGIPAGALLNLLKRLNGIEYINSIIVMRHGQIALEKWFAPYDRDQPHQIYSLSKSFTSCAVGLAQSEGRLRISDKLISFFPEYDDCITDPKMRQVTLRDLLTMRSGHSECANKYLFGTDDYVRSFLASPLELEPGSFFVYNSAASYMLAAVIRRVTGENVREYLMPRLFEPLQMTPGVWDRCPAGTDLGGWGLYLTTGDIARFAQLLLQDGVWGGKRLLPADYLAEATVRQADTAHCANADWQQGYGYHFWRSTHGFRGDGASGQYALVIKEYDLAIAVTSCTEKMELVPMAVWDELIPALADAPVPVDAAAQQELQDFLASARLPVITGDLERRHANVRYRFQPNDAGIRSCEIAFGRDDCTLTFQTPRGTEQVRAGFGFYATSMVQLADHYPHWTAACAAWQPDGTLKISSCILDGFFRDIWTICFDDPAEPVKHEGRCGCFRPLLPVLKLGEF